MRSSSICGQATAGAEPAAILALLERLRAEESIVRHVAPDPTLGHNSIPPNHATVRAHIFSREFPYLLEARVDELPTRKTERRSCRRE